MSDDRGSEGLSGRVTNYGRLGGTLPRGGVGAQYGLSEGGREGWLNLVGVSGTPVGRTDWDNALRQLLDGI
jgi:hypothetical protein